ncbi:MAG: GLPGLI family protein [Flavobacterium sp.]
MYKVLFFMLVCFNASAQKNDLYVVYNQIFDYSKPIERTAFLYADDSGSLYEDDMLTQHKQAVIDNEKWQKEQDKINADSNSKSFRFISEVKHNTFYKFNRDSNTVQFIQPVIKDRYALITDNVQQNWKLSQEKKVISGIECFKATTRFRGVDWEAWYAPSVPYPYGPWKLHGLPGLIIEAQDVNKRTNYTAVKIEFQKNDKLNKDLSSLVTVTIADKVTMQQFVAMRDEIVSQPLSTDRETTVKREVKKRFGAELIYEWEEEKKQ